MKFIFNIYQKGFLYICMYVCELTALPDGLAVEKKGKEEFKVFPRFLDKAS